MIVPMILITVEPPLCKLLETRQNSLDNRECEY